ncbi:MAG: D-hexose-6-phosphate mutarotase [Chitinivibrionales bacterium]|nr:D-hexose-6-phosphate mutarotase [Chitinivibrionales bacterium]
MDIQFLNDRYNASGHITFYQKAADVIFADVSTSSATATVSLYGGQVLKFKPAGCHEVLWVSKKSFFEKGKAIRGGIPVCWPWFGPHPIDRGLSQHGFVRTAQWEMVEATYSGGASENVRLVLRCCSEEMTPKSWPYHCTLNLVVVIGQTLDVRLETHNLHTTPLVISAGLHSYFTVGDIAQVRVAGVDGAAYIDSADEKKIKIQNGPLVIGTETDMDFCGVDGGCTITDPVLRRILVVNKTNSKATVVWNPWKEKAHSMKDMDDEEYKSMICIEAVNAFTDVVVVAPHSTQSLATAISVKPA